MKIKILETGILKSRNIISKMGIIKLEIMIKMVKNIVGILLEVKILIIIVEINSWVIKMMI